jgi:hypothetical protein
MKNIRKQTDIIIGGKDYLENFILPVVRELSRAPNEIAFDKLSDAATTQWENDGEGEFATYFRDVYLCKKWKNWYIGCTPIPGLGITNNPIESLNHLIKLLVC